MDYEKKYKEALEKARQLCAYPTTKSFISDLQDIFPELAEGEDEKVRKALLELVHDTTGDELWIDYNVHKEEALDWLERQGEHANFRNKIQVGDKVTRNEAGVLVNFTQLKRVAKPADKVEPKFKVGDWVIFNEHHNSVYQVEKIQGLRYYLRHYLGGTLSVHFDNELIRLWTLQDAKSGDVLACNEEILLFKSYSAQGRISLYCWYNGQTNNFHSKEVVDTLLTTRNKIYPATKEQRDILLKAMANAGYTFDFERKELKKIISEKQIKKNLQDNSFRRMFEQKPTWKPSDEQITQLQIVVDTYGNEGIYDPILTELLFQLKKIKGEV